MKQLKLTLIAVFGFSAWSFAQTTTIINTPSVQCGMCKSKIEKNLKKSDGITAVKVDYKQKNTTVTWDSTKTNLAAIRTQISKLGYDADDILSDKEAYENLPDCCKKP